MWSMDPGTLVPLRDAYLLTTDRPGLRISIDIDIVIRYILTRRALLIVLYHPVLRSKHWLSTWVGCMVRFHLTDNHHPNRFTDYPRCEFSQVRYNVICRINMGSRVEILLIRDDVRFPNCIIELVCLWMVSKGKWSCLSTHNCWLLLNKYYLLVVPTPMVGFWGASLDLSVSFFAGLRGIEP